MGEDAASDLFLMGRGLQAAASRRGGEETLKEENSCGLARVIDHHWPSYMLVFFFIFTHVYLKLIFRLKKIKTNLKIILFIDSTLKRLRVLQVKKKQVNNKSRM